MSTILVARQRRIRLGAVLPLAVAWVLLWGEWTLGNIINGILVAVVVVLVLPLPQVTFRGRVRLHRVIPLFFRFQFDLIVASVQIAWLAIRPGQQDVSSIVGVRLRSESELIMTVIAELISLMPGSLAIEVEPTTRTIYAHVLSAPDERVVEKFRLDVLELEERVIRAIGSDEEIESLRELHRGQRT
jgi:multicomponent Na+:H+ antiporter subunit E